MQQPETQTQSGVANRLRDLDWLNCRSYSIRLGSALLRTAERDVNRILKFRRPYLIAQWLGGYAGIVALAYGCFLAGFNFATAGFALVIAIVSLSMLGSFVGSITGSIVALGCLNYLFSPPLFSFAVEDPQDVLATLAFLTAAIVVTGLMSKVRRAREEELRETRAELARFARVAVLGEMTASITHEINQPLAGVVSSGNACQRWLSAQPPNIDRATESLNRIVRDANRASEVVGRVRSLIKNTPPQMGPLDINEAVNEVIILTRGEVARHRVTLTTALAVGLPPVRGDRVQLQQVCLNLIVNAIEAMSAREGGPRELVIGTALDDAGWVNLTVRDTGVGIEPDKLQSIFDAFHTTKRDGIGLGLAISRSIIDAHGGRMWATPNQPRGAVFQLTLPAKGRAA
jgi:signal transduction histidine kinase